MTPTTTQHNIRANARHIPQTTHYHKRAFDKKFEIVAKLPDVVMDEMNLNFGGFVVLDQADNQQDAVKLVRFYRGQQQ